VVVGKCLPATLPSCLGDQFHVIEGILERLDDSNVLLEA
jgi:hypothetical protein